MMKLPRTFAAIDAMAQSHNLSIVRLPDSGGEQLFDGHGLQRLKIVETVSAMMRRDNRHHLAPNPLIVFQLNSDVHPLAK